MFLIFDFSTHFAWWYQRRKGAVGVSFGWLGIYVCWKKELLYFMDKEEGESHE